MIKGWMMVLRMTHEAVDDTINNDIKKKRKR